MTLQSGDGEKREECKFQNKAHGAFDPRNSFSPRSPGESAPLCLSEDDHGKNALHYALRRDSPEMVHNIMAAMAQPLSLARICRTVVRRVVREKHGSGNR